MSHDAEFRDLFAVTYPVLARYTRHRGLARQDQEDVLAATYEVAWRRLDRVPAGDEALPWLLGVARNHIRNHRRRVRRDEGLLARLPAPAPVPGPGESDAGWPEVRRALGLLSEADRELILLVTWDELTPARAAAVLGISPGAARTRLHRARTRLAAHLTPISAAAPAPSGPASARRLTA